jgi:hypothetical protein
MNGMPLRRKLVDRSTHEQQRSGRASGRVRSVARPNRFGNSRWLRPAEPASGSPYPVIADLVVTNHSLAFLEVAALTVEDLRKEIPRREELLAEYEKLCRDIEADAVAMLEGETSNRWALGRPSCSLIHRKIPMC